MKILNIAAGKMKPLDLNLYRSLLINLDTMYYQGDAPDVLENKVEMWNQVIKETLYCKIDAFEFMERTKIWFDHVCIYRFLEHVSFTQVDYFIYLLSTITHPKSLIDVIVPNYTILAEMILNDDVNHSNFAANNILLTTELLNEPSCPHASIWTAERAIYFFELEKRFKVIKVEPVYKFDGRDIYLRFIAERVS